MAVNPALVRRDPALENEVSVASFPLLTEATLTEIPEPTPESAVPPDPVPQPARRAPLPDGLSPFRRLRRTSVPTLRMRNHFAIQGCF
jgi:hypothetical protein